MSDVAEPRRCFLRALLGVLVFAGLFQWPRRRAYAEGRKPVVYVFLQLDLKSSAIERALQEHLPDLTVTVFGRYRDFEEVLGSAHPDAVLCITPVLAYRGINATLQGMRAGSAVEAYVLASAGPLDGPLSGKTIGVVDLMGREGTESLLSRLLNIRDVKMKRVAKIEDLLPLLEFSAADGIVLSSAAVPRLTKRTRIPIKIKELPGGLVGLPAVAVFNPAIRDVVVNAFQKLDAATNALLGIDSWSVV